MSFTEFDLGLLGPGYTINHIDHMECMRHLPGSGSGLARSHYDLFSILRIPGVYGSVHALAGRNTVANCTFTLRPSQSLSAEMVTTFAGIERRWNDWH